MIQRSTGAVEISSHLSLKEIPDGGDWKSILKASRTTTGALLRSLGLEHHHLANAEAEQLFELRVPQPYLEKIEAGNPEDPLLLQVLPQSKEFEAVPGYSSDPLQEQEFSPAPGLIHKYPGRVLLITTQSCAIHCRYCFRRSFPYDAHRNGLQQWQAALAYISKNPRINEVILSGGDPLMMTNTALNVLLTQLNNIPNIKRVRIHSRLITTLPQRVDSGLLKLLGASEKRIVMVVHSNHPNEIGADVANAIDRIRQTGVLLYNQTVLLRGVNDRADILAELSERLFDANVQPYYLFTLDPVSGAAHFDVSRDDARSIYAELLKKLPGFLLPKLVSEIPGQSSKTPVDLGL